MSFAVVVASTTDTDRAYTHVQGEACWSCLSIPAAQGKLPSAHALLSESASALEWESVSCLNPTRTGAKHFGRGVLAFSWLSLRDLIGGRHDSGGGRGSPHRPTVVVVVVVAVMGVMVLRLCLGSFAGTMLLCCVLSPGPFYVSDSGLVLE